MKILSTPKCFLKSIQAEAPRSTPTQLSVHDTILCCIDLRPQHKVAPNYCLYKFSMAHCIS